ncbi:MAG TPA: Gfo/Idh/MocA family oxidoreductase, partial [Candidatus Paceibacterota bacterium]|nr:Gfo/Idh/MocA family oxidoreductase [Candidatus Paceibacterota bacterium]
MSSRAPSRLSFNRRQFLKTTTLAAGAATFGIPALLRGQNLNSKLNIACIGANGKGSSDTDLCAGENIVALCDVDRAYCAGQLKKYPDARFFQDFRRMLEEMGNSIDAVTVSTPDHFHAIAAAAAIQRGKHVYCQKPLTQTIFEARQLRDLARKHRIISQMGNQGSAEDGLRRAVEVIQAGVIGQVREVHVWTNRPIWPQGISQPEGADPVPPELDWDLWIGPAAMRPYKKGVYHPWNWRGWLDYGTGALGDMACHTVNMPFRALKLGYPSVIEAESSGMNGQTYPLASKIRFEFPSRGGKAKA